MRKKPMNIGIYTLGALIVFFIGYVSFDKLNDPNTTNQFPDRETTFTSKSTNNTLRDSIVEYGIELLGTPYVTAGSGKEGFDCSGFVNFVYHHFNINVPRSSAAFENFGKEIPIAEVEKGDLLLFLSPTRNAIGHIGIITNAKGPESDFIHASSGRQMKVIITNLSNEGYTRRFVKAIRVL
ncbi:MAG: C40 family peptidase [Gillisia sp.]